MTIEHKEWKSIYKELPEDGAVCVSSRSGKMGGGNHTFITED